MTNNIIAAARAAVLHLCLCFASLAPAIGVAAQDAVVDFNIPAQPLARALATFQSQGKAEVVYRPEIVAGKQSRAVSGRMSAPDALAALLAGSGLEVRRMAGGSLVIQPAAVQTNEQQLREVEVRASSENAWGPVEGYSATRSATATKTDTPLLETPRSISVITQDQIRDQQVDEVSTALRYTPGVFAEHRGADTSRPNLVIRGFRDTNPLFLDGMRGFGTNFNSISSEVYGFERVEVLRGPASMHYGAGSPGGIVNGVSKRPRPERFAEIEGTVGSHGQSGLKFDVGGAIDDGQRFLYRMTGLARGGDAQIDFVKDNRMFFAPAFTWRPGANTTLTVLTRFQEDDTYEVQFVPASGTVFPNPNGRISTGFFVGEPGYGGYEKEDQSIGYLFEHRFSNALVLRQSLRYEHRKLDFRTIGGLGFQADMRTLDRSVFTAIDKVNSLTTDTNLQGRFKLGAVEHTLLAGVDYKRASTSEWLAFTPGNPIDAFAPVYGQPVPDPVPFQDQSQKARQTGIYVQDQMKLTDALTVMLGVRHDRAKIDTFERLAAVQTNQKDSAYTGQAGVVYRFANGIAPYVSYAKSFEPQAGTTATGMPFVPTKGKQYEAGVKYQPPGSTSLITLALFELTQQNVVTTDPNNPFFGIQTGEVRSRGFEAEARVNLLAGLNVIATYSHTDLEVTKSNDPDLGKTPTRVPANLASLWVDYTLARAPFNGLGFGAGVRYVGSSYGDFMNTFKVPDFTLVDAAIHYTVREGSFRGARLALNASNMFDKYYVASCEAEGFCTLGMRRVVTGSLRVPF